MGFIKDKERKSLISKINQSYGFRKFLISFEILALIGFIIVVFLQGTGIIKAGYLKKEGDLSQGLTGFGIGMLVYACVIAIFGIVALILTFTIKAPRKTKEEMNKLQSSALSGKRVHATDTNVTTNKERTTLKGSKKK